MYQSKDDDDERTCSGNTEPWYVPGGGGRLETETIYGDTCDLLCGVPGMIYMTTAYSGRSLSVLNSLGACELTTAVDGNVRTV